MNTDWKRRFFYEQPKPELPPPDLGIKLLDAAVIIAGLLAFLALLSWAQTKDAEEIAASRAQAPRYAVAK